MANSIFSGASPNDFLADKISQAGALSGQLNARRTEPLISLRGGEVSRLTFANGQAIDPLNVWTQVGAPAVSGLLTGSGVREGSGPFTDSDYWQLGTGLDPLDFAGDYTIACVFFKTSTIAGIWMANGLASTDGYYSNVVGFGAMAVGRAGFSETVGSNATFVTGAVNVVCFGRAGGNILAKGNLTAVNSTASVGQTPAVTRPLLLGRYTGAGQPLTGAYILEFYASTQTASDALFTAIANDVKTKLGVAAW